MRPSMRKQGLCTQNTPIHNVFPLLFNINFYNSVRLYDISYEMLHKWCKFHHATMITCEVI